VRGKRGRPARRRRVAMVVAGAFALALAVRVHLRSSGTARCPPAGTLVVVDTREHAMALCEGGRAASTFPVRLGRGGTGKEREGDRRTPLGTYPLGAPRASAAYGTFVPIGYPTDEQRARGLTGGAIGLHGPDRRVAWAGRLVNVADTTDGCIGVATDDAMHAVVAWLGERRARVIEVR
jgi:L,D-peptidoglycan transpeptidase YkuD (ErfK/YbiS/YcfS/YnhG family)